MAKRIRSFDDSQLPSAISSLVTIATLIHNCNRC
jgi:hypothetical protein